MKTNKFQNFPIIPADLTSTPSSPFYRHILYKQHAIKKTDTTSSNPNQLFITNLTYDCQLDDIKRIFGPCGPISSISFGILPQHKEIDKSAKKISEKKRKKQQKLEQSNAEDGGGWTVVGSEKETQNEGENEEENEESEFSSSQPITGFPFYHGAFVRLEFNQKKSIKKALEMSIGAEPKKLENEESSESDEDVDQVPENIIKNDPLIEDEGTRKEIGTSRGLKKWLNQYHDVRVSPTALQQEVDTFMKAFATKEAERIKEKHETHNQMDDDGFIKVQKGSSRRNTHTDGTITVTTAKGTIKPKKEKVLLDFYRFQRRKAREEQITELRKKFEEDKLRISKLKAARRFKPY